MKFKFAVFVVMGLVFCFSFCDAKNYSYGYSKPRNYTKGGTIKVQKGYIRKKTGQYVTPHLKTNPDQYKFNNLKQ